MLNPIIGFQNKYLPERNIKITTYRLEKHEEDYILIKSLPDWNCKMLNP